jgi:hypothetical protein
MASSTRSASLDRRHVLRSQFFERLLVLSEMRQSHAAQHVWRLGELDIVVTDNLDAIAPWVEKVEKRSRQRLDPGIGQSLADCIFVVDHKSEMAALVSRLSSAFLHCEELVAEVDEGRSAAFAPKLEVQQSEPEPLRYHRIPALRD